MLERRASEADQVSPRRGFRARLGSEEGGVHLLLRLLLLVP